MKNMRTDLLLSIFVFISTLFWPQLLDKYFFLISVATALIFLGIPGLRILTVIPITAMYFTVYANLTLTGQLLPSTKIVNDNALATFVDGKDHNIVVEIISLISENNRGYFKAKLIEVDTDHLNYSPLIEMRWYKADAMLQAGQLHRFNARFKPVYGRANPGGFDRQKWSYSEHIAYQATIKEYLSLINEVPTIRAAFYEKVQLLTDNLNNQGVLLALSFADKSLIPFEEKARIRNLGISHLFAISGLHIGLLFSAVYLIAQWLYKRIIPASKMGWFSHRLINFTALTGAWGYAYLAGFSLPTQRAFLMLLVAVMILSLKRKCFKVDVLLLVLFVVLIWDPLAVLSVSLWLSFSAVAIILLLLWAFPINQPDNTKSEKLLTKVSTKKSTITTSIIKYVKLLIILQLGLTFLMLPIQLEIFSGLSLVAVMVNLIAVPLFSLIVIPMVLLALGIVQIYEPLALIIFQLCDQIISIFFTVTAFTNENYQYYSSLDRKLMIIAFVMILLMFIFHFQKLELRKISYLFVFFILCLLNLKPAESRDSWFIEVIDVGQGLAVLVRSGDETLLYDTGARYPSGFNMVDSEITPYLISLGINQLQHLVISHSDNDHAGGADIVAQRFTVLHRWSGEPLNSQYDFEQCSRGQNWLLGALQVEVLSPTKLTSNNNNNSCVLRISDANTSVLLTGDIEKKQEKILIKQLGEKLNSDILLAPHHGSRHSSSEPFIEAVSPKWVVFSAGFMNHWGFPTNEVLKRYQKQSVKTFNSGLSGLIRFQISAQAIKIKTFREDLAPYWYHHSFDP
jgi:competence protein ComEC